jgi:hypothetical protein
MAAPTLNEPFYSFVITPEEKAAHEMQLLADALIKEANREQQNQEDAEFRKQLDEKNLAELMQLQRVQQEEAERKTSALKSVSSGDASALLPYMSGSQMRRANDMYYINTQSLEDDERIIAAGREKHIPDNVPAVLSSSYSPVREGQDPALALEETKKWLEETFSSRPTSAVLLRMRDGENVVVSLGVSHDEVDAARALQNDQRRAEVKSAEITSRIQERIKEESQKVVMQGLDEAPRSLTTPDVQRSSAPSFRDV